MQINSTGSGVGGRHEKACVLPGKLARGLRRTGFRADPIFCVDFFVRRLPFLCRPLVLATPFRFDFSFAYRRFCASTLFLRRLLLCVSTPPPRKTMVKLAQFELVSGAF